MKLSIDKSGMEMPFEKELFKTNSCFLTLWNDDPFYEEDE